MSLFLLNFYIWRPPRLSELTLMIFNTGLTHLGLHIKMDKCIKFPLASYLNTIYFYHNVYTIAIYQKCNTCVETPMANGVVKFYI